MFLEGEGEMAVEQLGEITGAWRLSLVFAPPDFRKMRKMLCESCNSPLPPKQNEQLLFSISEYFYQQTIIEVGVGGREPQMLCC